MENLKLPLVASCPVRSLSLSDKAQAVQQAVHTEPGGGWWHLGRQWRQGKPRAAGGASYYGRDYPALSQDGQATQDKEAGLNLCK